MTKIGKTPSVRFGIDLGGTKIEIIALDRANRLCYRRRVATPRNNYLATLSAIVDLVTVAETELGCQGTVGIGTPGTISRVTGRMKNCNSVWLNDQTLLEDLQQRLARPVRIANDADCFTLSEASGGAAAGLSVVFGVILGTGVGGGIVVNGKLLQGPNGIAGEWGHNPLPWPSPEELPGPPCYCGKSGCIETFLSGPGMSHDYAKLTGQTLSSKEIVARAEAGDSQSEEILRRYENRLARGLAQVINLLDPTAIVLGGGLSQCARWYRTVPQLWQDYIFSDRVETHLLAPKFGDSSGVRGAAWLWGKAS